MKTQIISCLLLITLASFSIHAQTKVEPAWVKHFGSCQPPENNAASAMEVDRFGNVYVTGYKGDSLEASRDYATIKYDTDGIEQWIRLYNGSGNGKDEAIALAIDPAGNVYITGTSLTSSRYGYVTFKFNSAGLQKWISISSDNYNRHVTSLAIDRGGNVLVIGKNNQYYDACLIVKYDHFGNELWKRFTKRTCYSPPLISVDISGNFFVLFMHSDQNYYVEKYNEFGAFLKSIDYNGPANYIDWPLAITIDDSSNAYISGCSTGLGTGYDHATIKYNANLEAQWVARYNHGLGNTNDYAIAVAVDTQENVYVAGGGWDVTSSNDYVAAKYDRNGIEQWVARYNDPSNSDDIPTASVLDNEGNIYITGYSLLDTDTTYDYLTVKYNPAGELQWAMRYDHPSHANDYARDIAVDDSGNVYVTGTSYGKGWSAYTTIKYVQFTEPLFSIAPDSVDFGQVLVSTSETVSVTISNPGADTLIISRVDIDPPGEFAIAPTSATIPAGGTAIFQIRFEPNSLGVKFARMIIFHNAPGSPDTVKIRGVAMQSLFSIKPTIIDFGKVATDTLKHKQIVVSNKGNIELKVFVHQSPDTIFHVQPDSGTVAPFDSLIFITTFQPNVKEEFIDTVIFHFMSRFDHVIGDSTIVVLLKGQGISPVSVAGNENDLCPVSFTLHQNYPNPFNPSTTISYSLPKTSQVMLKIFDILGQEIAALVNERQEAGEYKIEWQAAGFQSGIYVCRLQAGEFSAVRKVILLK